MKEVCDFYESKKEVGLDKISEVFALNRDTVRNYLKRGAQIGLCTYSVAESMKLVKRIRAKALGEKSHLLGVRIRELYETRKPITKTKIAEMLGISRNTVIKHLKHH